MGEKIGGLLQFEKKCDFNDFIDKMKEEELGVQSVAWAPLMTITFFQASEEQHKRIMEMNNKTGTWYNENELSLSKEAPQPTK